MGENGQPFSSFLFACPTFCWLNLRAMMLLVEEVMAKTLIIYATKYGTTETCATLLQKHLQDGAVLQNIAQQSKADLDAYDTVVLGGAVYAGRANGRLRRFCSANEQALLSKRLGLFLCMMEEGDGAVKQLEQNYSQALREKALVMDYFGGEFLFSNMGWLARKIIKMMSKGDEDVHNIREDAIKAFAEVLNR
jgi:menaquinone-dependent protoporphyrinogen oxidase